MKRRSLTPLLSFLSLFLVAGCCDPDKAPSNSGAGPNTGGASPAGGGTAGTSAGGQVSAGGASGGLGGAGGNGGNGGAGSGGSASGGSGNMPSGGASSSGGSAAGGAPINTDPPFYPTTISEADAQAAYDTWKAVHLEDCGGGVWRVPWENAKLDATVSEGIGYGMILTVTFDDRTAFDGLLAYSKLMHDDNGLMNWLRYDCDAHWDTKYNEHPDEAASDADLDVAMALLMAECKWGEASYGEEASNVIRAIKDHMFMDFEGLSVLQPGDSGWFDDLNNGCVNYSYMAPAYYRTFAAHLPEDADFWNKAADDTYALLDKASDPGTGLVRNWGSSDGNQATDECHNAYNRAGSYGDDAARTPWRVATDYLWFGTEAAKAWNDKATEWVKSQGIANLVQWYNLDGSPDTEAGGWEDHTAINVGPFAVGAMTYDQATVNEFAADLVSIPTDSGAHDAEYFPRMLKALSLITMTGQFTQCGGQ